MVFAKVAEYDGFLVACYSHHPLVGRLKVEIKSWARDNPNRHRKFVLGIFEASILHALALTADEAHDGAWGIITTGVVWETLLSTGVEIFLASVKGGKTFRGVESTGLNATELHEKSKDEVEKRIQEATKRLLIQPGYKRAVRVVCLGCAGMAGLESAVKTASTQNGYAKDELMVVDGVKAGILMLHSLLRASY